ncbi:flagellar brake protein [Methylomagnum ishizawai]|uniref:flagellar brake protein n=1 Tax=Methylomagnum ishizawai TaxID=1760988 RepID=UPI001C32EA0C|nr:flagellar brake protein [Methylomagnum ishizawai]BBL75274.1 flagellar brake protein YcgR [Methylomagnum ishizawai]
MHTESIEDHVGYTLRGQGEILEKLRLMQRKRCLVTAHHQDSKANLVTAIVEILPERGWIVFDMGSNEAVNRQFAKARPLVFMAQVEGVRSQFVVEGLTETTWRGEPVFAAPLPQSLFWHQQREFYRVAIPLAMPVKCRVGLEGGAVEFGVYDLSLSGLSLSDKNARIGAALEVGHTLEACKLSIPSQPEIPVNLEIRNKIPQVRPDRPQAQRVGCAFRGLGRGAETQLQKFIFEVELWQKRLGAAARYQSK